ncbi:Calcium-transporting ATPase 4, endoplasmic reticulum-type -like protein [Gossypium arboreum]|uniref:Calcium-transporting ATPase 4, endoplasmic reticulum-type-like protein n=1 Tax=Gossypium arboreum TaxID=29729 RepID=A0A0B0MTC5_GOSAR|nr:Calcium-transporting ATPase 4, endoplasmic reticulum-type -like protein [Gossypium arboreum]
MGFAVTSFRCIRNFIDYWRTLALNPLVIGMYVGKATVGVFVIWYAHHSFMGIDLSGDCHSLVTKLPTGINVVPGKISESPFAAGSQQFKFGKFKTIEMFNSLNALSDDGSLLTKPPWLLFAILNEWLLIAVLILIDLVLKFVGRHKSGLRYSAPTKTSKQKTE